MTTGPGVTLRMRIELDPSAVGEPSWPDGIAVRTFTGDDAIALYALLAPDAVELKVEAANAAAIRLYERAGLCVAERLR